MIRLRLQQELVRSYAATEGLMFVAGAIFGSNKQKGRPPTHIIGSADDAHAFASLINGGR